MTRNDVAGKAVRCAIYTRKSTDEGLEQEFNSLDAQRESAEAYVASQRHEGWLCLPDRYDDGGFTGGNMERPALKRLLADIQAGRIDCIVVYKVDRLSRSLLDFARTLLREGMSHRTVARGAPEDAFEQGAEAIADVAATGPPVPPEHGLHTLVDLHVDDRGMLPIVALLVAGQLPDADDVGEQLEQAGLGERAPASFAALARYPQLIVPATGIEFLDDSQQSFALQVELSNRRYRYYVCLTAQKRGWHTCPTKSVPALEIEKFVVDQIRALGRDEALVAETIRQAREQGQKRIGELEAERKALGRQLERDSGALRKLAGQIANGGPVTERMADIQDRIRATEQRATQVKEELIALRGKLVDEDEAARTLALFDPIWDTLAPREQARIIRLLIEQVSYDGEKGTVSVSFHPSGIKALAGELAEASA